MGWKARWIAPEGALLAAMALAVILSLYGIWWGWVEDWNPDQMAQLPLFPEGGLPFQPIDLEKPPFYTYMSFFLSTLPIKGLERVAELLTGSEYNWRVAVLYLCRLIQVGLLAGIVAFSHAAMRNAIGRFSAAVAALLIATSAGFVLQAHFLTTDIPVTFFMLLSFWLAQRIVVRPSMRSYLLAGLVVGIATATKYNGLAVGLAIPIFHLFANPRASLRRIALDPRLIFGVSMVIVGFVLANPFAVIDFRRFVEDFAYNYVITPAYGGLTEGSSFGSFALMVLDIVGVPLGVLLPAGAVVALASIRGSSVLQRSTVAAALGVFALYFVTFGRAPRVEVRFLLPAVPFLFIAAGPAWSALYSRLPRSAVTLASLLCAYGAMASIMVGHRFANDPRMAALSWVAGNVPAGSTIESTSYSPRWDLLPGVDVVRVEVPNVTGRRLLFTEAFGSDPEMVEAVEKRENETDVEWFSADSLRKRNPDFVTIHTLYSSRFTEPEVTELYPTIGPYFRQLIRGELGYSVVFDEESKEAPAWLYPREIDYVDGQLIILRRVSASRMPRRLQTLQR